VLVSGACNCGGPATHKVATSATAAPQAIDFGQIELGGSASRPVMLTASGLRSVNIRSMHLAKGDAAFTIHPPAGTVLTPTPVQMNVSYMPPAVGTDSDELLIETDATDTPELKVSLQGSGVRNCVDADHDGYGDHCLPGPDCDDMNAAVHPGATELCNGIDDNCNGETDEGFDVGQSCIDTVQLANGPCSRLGTYACSSDGTSSTCQPVAVMESCNGIDDNCNGETDEGIPGVGAMCQAPDSASGCWRSGVGRCDSAGMVNCVPDPNAPLVCCPTAGQEQNADGACCTPLPMTACAYTCDIDVTGGTTTCSGPVTVDEISPGTGRISMDLGTTYTGVEFDLTMTDPTGYVWHLGDSSTDNGWGGDSGTSSNDAELQIVGTAFAEFGNDNGGSPMLANVASFVPASGTSMRSIWVADQRVQSFDPCVDVTSPYSLRVNPPTDQEMGTPDAAWHMGLNRVYDEYSSDRSGTGLTAVTLCFR
jgi:hypothetical protein